MKILAEIWKIWYNIKAIRTQGFYGSVRLILI